MINNPEPDDDPVSSQQDRAYVRLREDILAGELLPLSKLHISNLRQRYETSVGPIREALSRLSGEGLVNKRGQRGHWVAPLSLEEMRDVTRLRVMLETDALRQSIRRGDLEWEAQIVAAMHRLKSVHSAPKALARAVEKENRDFHMALISRCPSRWQLRFIGALYDQTARYRRLSVLRQPEQPRPEPGRASGDHASGARAGRGRCLRQPHGPHRSGHRAHHRRGLLVAARARRPEVNALRPVAQGWQSAACRRGGES